MIQLSKTTKHQTLPLVKGDTEPKVLPDRPVILQKTIKHNNLTKSIDDQLIKTKQE